MDGETCQTILARRAALSFYDIPIAVAVHDGKVWGAYVGNWEPYEIRQDPMVITLAIEMGLFELEGVREFKGGDMVKWYMNRRP